MTCKRGDIVELGEQLDNGMRVAVRHTADHRMVVGQARPVQQGENLTGCQLLIGKSDGQRMFVEEELDLRGGCRDEMPMTHAATLSHARPAKVTSDEYREGWDRIFRPPVGQA